MRVKKVDVQIQKIGIERYNEIIKRYNQFKEDFSDTSKTPVRVFDPLNKKAVEELELIREVSRFLQAKKDEDMKKAEEAAEKALAEKKLQEKEDKEKSKEESKQDEESKNDEK